jgi:hypothetical protein
MKTIIALLGLAFFLLLPALCYAGESADLDDGISKYTDEGVEKYDELGKADPNIKFIVLNAKSKAQVIKGNKDKDGATGKTGGANMNSVVLGAGSKVKGDIYIIDQSKGPKTNVAD